VVWVGVAKMGCFNLMASFIMRKVKRILVNQNYHDKFYPHSMLTLTIQMVIAYNEVEKFAKTWCDGVTDVEILKAEVTAVKEIFEAENKDDAVWRIELMTNKHTNENVDRLIYLVSTLST
jgi:hypothetical protein